MAEKITGAELIAAERQRQIEKEGWTADHDDEHDDGAMVSAAIAYAHAGHQHETWPPQAVHFWPWRATDWKPSDDPIRNLVKAGALIAAEIDRLQRASGVGDG